jgi:hypothetical protein
MHIGVTWVLSGLVVAGIASTAASCGNPSIDGECVGNNVVVCTNTEDVEGPNSVHTEWVCPTGTTCATAEGPTTLFITGPEEECTHVTADCVPQPAVACAEVGTRACVGAFRGVCSKMTDGSLQMTLDFLPCPDGSACAEVHGGTGCVATPKVACARAGEIACAGDGVATCTELADGTLAQGGAVPCPPSTACGPLKDGTVGCIEAGGGDCSRQRVGDGCASTTVTQRCSETPDGKHLWVQAYDTSCQD